MSDTAISWFYHQDGDRKGPFTSEQIGTLIRAGVVDGHTKVWSETLGEWTPLFRTELRALLGDRAVEPSPLPAEEPVAKAAPAYDAAAFSQPFDPAVVVGQDAPHPAAAPARTYPLRDNRGLAKVLRALIWVNGLISVWEFGLILKAKGGIEAQYRMAKWLETNDTVLLIVGVLFLVTIAVFLWWKYRSTANLFHLRGPQTIALAGAVYWYFVPVAWFWKPYEAMQNLYRGFNAGDPAHNRQHNQAQVQVWWLCFWGAAAIAAAVVVLTPDPVQTVPQAKFYVFGSMAVCVVEGLWCLFAAQLVKAISAAEARAMGQ